MHDNETKERFIELRARSLSYIKIADELGVSKQTLINWSKELDKEISNLRAIEFESLQETHYALKSRRIELLGEQTQALKAEISKRDLSDISTEKLFALVLRYAAALKEEETLTIFKGGSELEELLEFGTTSWVG